MKSINNKNCSHLSFSLSRSIYFAILLIFVFSMIISAAVVPDSTFGENGKVSFGFTDSSSDFVYAAALQSDGKIVIAGTSGEIEQGIASRNFAVARVNTNGTLDKTFGNSGLVTTDFSGWQDIANAIAIQTDGKIIVGGFRETDQSNSGVFALARYNIDGSLDTTFSGGKVTTDFEESNLESIRHLLIQSDGKIVAVGFYTGVVFSGTPPRIAMVRYNTNGTLDSSFGDNGKFTILIHRFTEVGGAALQSDDKIVLSGYFIYAIPGCVTKIGTNCDVHQSFLLRYDSQMRLDKKFGRRFGKEFNREGFGNRLRQISIQSDGKLLVANDHTTKRYSNNGRLETTFDQATFESQTFKVEQLTQRPDGKIVGCGSLPANGQNNIGLALFDTNGSLIGSGQQDFFGHNDSCNKIITQSDGKIIVVGSAQIASQSGFNFGVVRYLDITP